MIDIFEFWKDVDAATRVHPEDRETLFRLSTNADKIELKQFEFECCPAPFYGPLKTAPVVLLYLNPGFSERDLEEAATEAGQQFWLEQRSGKGLLRSQKGVQEKSWWVSRTSFLGFDPECLRNRLAVLEICPYHSKNLDDRSILAALPSCRVSVDWAQNVLFPEAIAGHRVVICLRAAAYWGLKPGKRYGQSLFAPNTVRSGHLLNDEFKQTVKTAVEKIIRVAGR